MNKKTNMIVILAALILIAGAATWVLLGKFGEGGGMRQETTIAMYIPFGKGEHIFVGEQSGVFTATFPEKIYDISGKKITQEQLKRGNMVKIYGNGIMLESYPGQYPGITRMEVIEEGQPSDADIWQYLVDEIYTEPDPSVPPTMNVGYTTDLASVVAMVNRGGYEWAYEDKDGLSNAVVADAPHVLQWKTGEELADIRIDDAVNISLYFSEKPVRVEAVRYDAALLGTGEIPEGEKVSVAEKNGEFVIKGVTAGYVYDITGIWDNGHVQYGFITVGKD